MSSAACLFSWVNAGKLAASLAPDGPGKLRLPYSSLFGTPPPLALPAAEAEECSTSVHEGQNPQPVRLPRVKRPWCRARCTKPAQAGPVNTGWCKSCLPTAPWEVP